MRSLLSRELKKNDFDIYKGNEPGPTWEKITEDALFTSPKKNQINFKGNLMVEFYGQPADIQTFGSGLL